MDITKATTIAEFRAFRALLDEMAAWDAFETGTRGYDSEALLRICYSDGAEALQEQFSQPGAALFLSRHEGQVVGCAGYSDLSAGIAEVEKVFVRPSARGLGAGAALVRTVLTGMTDSNYLRARLETAEFMAEAIGLYRRFGFQVCPAFRAPMGDLGPMTVFMERELQDARKAQHGPMAHPT